MTRVAIGIITFRRPQGLSRLLEHIAQLTFAGDESNRPELRVLVVENEENGAARDICARLRPTFPFPLEFAVEPQRGIPFARNRVVELTRDVDFLAFLDDDEWPEPAWLDELLSMQRQTAADMVAAPVLPEYEANVPRWTIRGGFHIRRRWEHGRPMTPMSTCNVLLGRAVCDAFAVPFDTRFALTGGSDSHFFQRAARAGFRGVWCDTAIARELVPASRATVGWVCRRAFRSGANFARTQFEVQPLASAARATTWRVLKHLGWGLAGFPIALVWRGWAGCVQQLSHLSRAGGMVAGLFGRQYAEYETIHGH